MTELVQLSVYRESAPRRNVATSSDSGRFGNSAPSANANPIFRISERLSHPAKTVLKGWGGYDA